MPRVKRILQLITTQTVSSIYNLRALFCVCYINDLHELFCICYVNDLRALFCICCDLRVLFCVCYVNNLRALFCVCYVNDLRILFCIFYINDLCAMYCSGAPWPRKFGNLCIREILVVTWPYVRPTAWPPAPQVHQYKITQSTGMGTQMQLKVLFGRKSHGRPDF